VYLLKLEEVRKLGSDDESKQELGSNDAERTEAAEERQSPLTTLEWGKEFLPEYFACSSSAMHRWLGGQLDGMSEVRGAKINLIGPRGSAKSTVATFCYVLKAALEGQEKYIWIVSDTKDQARIHLDNLEQELSENEKLKGHYQATIRRGRRWRSAAIQLANKVSIESFGTGQGMRGRRRGANRPTLIVCDDLQNDSHIASGAQREASRRWFLGTLLNAGTPTTNVVNLATALHRDALAMELARTPGWTSRTFPSIVTWPRNNELWEEWEEIYCNVDNPDAIQEAREFYERRQAEMEAGAEVLWKEVENLYSLMRMRVEIGQTAFDREKQGLPVNPEMCEWPEEYFGEHIWFDAWPDAFEVRAIALDPSKGRDAGRGDYSAYVLLGIDRRNVVYVEADLARRPTPRMVEDGVAHCLRFRPRVFGVEANQYQELLCKEFAVELARQGVTHLVPGPIFNYANKLVRIRRLGPLLAQRRLRFLRASFPTQLLVQQLRDFPCGAHDDGPDALEMAWRLAEEMMHKATFDDGLGDRLPVG
jgi:predicted phage terminase large subunit-like protein